MQYPAFKLLLLSGLGQGVLEEDVLAAVYGKSAMLVGHTTLDKLIRRLHDKLHQVGLTVLPVEQSGYALVTLPQRSRRSRGEQ
jgi:hypothetical protein